MEVSDGSNRGQETREPHVLDLGNRNRDVHARPEGHVRYLLMRGKGVKKMSDTMVDYPVPPVVETHKRPWIPIVAVGVVIIGLAVFAGVQTASLSGVNAELTASQHTVTGLEGQVSGLESDLGNAEASVSSLEGTVSEQETQLASCYRANSLSVKADKALHDAVGQIVPAAFGSSRYGFDAALARYRTAAHQWAVAANACEPGGGYSFG